LPHRGGGGARPPPPRLLPAEGAARRAWQDLSVFWRRRIAVMAGVALLVGIPATLLISSGGDETGGGSAGAPVMPRLNPAFHDHALGISFRTPKGWKETKSQGVVRFTSPDKQAGITLSSPGAAGDANGIFDQALAVIKRNYENVQVGGQTKRDRLAGRPAETAALWARNPKGGDLSILVAVTRGKQRAYLVEFFAGAAGRPENRLEAQAALDALKLNG
jgi:hypothetical protein